MSQRQLPLKDLLELLPRMPEFDALRIALLHASAMDLQPGDAQAYATLDDRLVRTTSLGRLLMSAEHAFRERVKSLYEGAMLAFLALASDDAGDRIARLLALGEAAEAEDRWRDALAYYSLGERVAVATGHATVQVRLRLGRANLNVGRMQDAVALYHQSLIDAVAAADQTGQIIAATGLGNAASWAGRWTEADAWYERALSMCGDAQREVRAQLLINRAMIANEQAAPDRAEHWLAETVGQWDELTPTTRAGWLNIRGLVHLRREQLTEAENAFREALVNATSAFFRAMILDNLAETALRAGDFAVAQVRAREAEEIALEHGSARVLAEIYMRLGRCSALQLDINGVAFFEKSLALMRDGQYPLLLGKVYREYADFRYRLNDRPAARALLLKALAVFNELGAHTAAAETERLLHDIPEG